LLFKGVAPLHASLVVAARRPYHQRLHAPPRWAEGRNPFAIFPIVALRLCALASFR